MSRPDIQFFDRAGTWLRPPGAAEADVITRTGGTAHVRTFRGLEIPASIDVEASSGYVLVVTRLAQQEARTPRPVKTRTPGAEWPQHAPCPACSRPVLVTLGSRHGGQAEVFDPEPGTGPQFNTMLAADLSHIALVAAQTGHMRGKVQLWRPHRYSCDMRVPGEEPLPSWGGYSHGASTRRDTAR